MLLYFFKYVVFRPAGRKTTYIGQKILCLCTSYLDQVRTALYTCLRHLYKSFMRVSPAPIEACIMSRRLNETIPHNSHTVVIT